MVSPTRLNIVLYVHCLYCYFCVSTKKYHVKFMIITSTLKRIETKCQYIQEQIITLQRFHFNSLMLFLLSVTWYDLSLLSFAVFSFVVGYWMYNSLFRLCSCAVSVIVLMVVQSAHCMHRDNLRLPSGPLPLLRCPEQLWQDRQCTYNTEHWGVFA